MEFRHSKQLAYSPAYNFVFKGYADMLEHGLTHPCMDFGNQTEVVYVLENEKVVCAQLFQVEKIGRVYTVLAYTDPEFRGQGYAVKLFEFLEALLKQRSGFELKVIYTGAVDENDSIHRVLKKTGRDHFISRYVKFY